jgi:hypothetical protein
MVTSQAIEPVRLRLEETGMRLGRAVILKHRQKPYLNRELFVDYIQTVFLPHLADLPRNEQLSSEETPSLMDNSSPYLTLAAVELHSRARVRIITLESHPTQIFQVLDLALFGVLERPGQY